MHSECIIQDERVEVQIFGAKKLGGGPKLVVVVAVVTPAFFIFLTTLTAGRNFVLNTTFAPTTGALFFHRNKTINTVATDCGTTVPKRMNSP